MKRGCTTDGNSARRPSSRGFTLVEIMVALALTGMVTIAIYTVYEGQNQSYITQERVAAMQQNARAALFVIAREIRMAGFDSSGTAGAGFTNCADDSLTFTYLADDDGQDNDNDGTTDNDGELSTIRFDLYDAYSDGDTDIGITVDGAARRPVAENVQEMEFAYTLVDDSTDPPTVTTTTAPPAANMDEIRTITITLLVRTEGREKNWTDRELYATPGGNAWGPYNDGFRRRLVSTTMKCRNMGL